MIAIMHADIKVQHIDSIAVLATVGTYLVVHSVTADINKHSD
jgi:hypothetical protein